MTHDNIAVDEIIWKQVLYSTFYLFNNKKIVQIQGKMSEACLRILMKRYIFLYENKNIFSSS